MPDEQERGPRPPRDGGPETIEEPIRSFGRVPPGGGTIQGMPAARPPTDAPPQLAPIEVPQIIYAPSDPVGLPPDGPTVPDGLPALMVPPEVLGLASPAIGQGSFEQGSFEPPSGSDDLPTDPYAGQRLQGVVPSPDAPKIQISKSMELDVSRLDPDDDPASPPAVAAARRAVAQPTEVMLEALQRREDASKEGSDLWLVFGLLFLGVVILGLIAAVVFGVLQRLG